jgi:hypothetical protein
MAIRLHSFRHKERSFMFIRLLHAPGVRLVLVLAGTVMFVQSSTQVSLAGIALMVAGAFVIVAAGADVAYRPANSGGNA